MEGVFSLHVSVGYESSLRHDVLAGRPGKPDVRAVVRMAWTSSVYHLYDSAGACPPSTVVKY